MSWFIYFIIGAAITALTGYVYGKMLLKRAQTARSKAIVTSDNDSVRNAKEIAGAIKERAFIIGNRNLSWDIKNHKGGYVETSLFSGAETKSFLKGESTMLIKFIRRCHSHGCSVMLRQIGEKMDVTEGKGDIIYLSMPEDIHLYRLED